MREASEASRLRCTYLSYLVTILPLILTLIWLTHGTLSPDQLAAGGYPPWNLAGYAMDFGTFNDAVGYPDAWRMFNWHPTMMILAFVTLFSQGALHFRLLRVDHDTAKLIHVITQTLCVIFSSVGLGIIVKFKEHMTGLSQFYNPHGWLGITAYTLFLLQWLHGLSYFLTCCPSEARRLYKPYHMWAGLWIYIATAMAVLSGLAGYAWIFQSMAPVSTAPYHWPNFVAVSVFICVGVVAYHLMPTGLPPGAQGQIQTAGDHGGQTPGASYTAMKPGVEGN